MALIADNSGTGIGSDPDIDYLPDLGPNRDFGLGPVPDTDLHLGFARLQGYCQAIHHKTDKSEDNPQFHDHILDNT